MESTFYKNKDTVSQYIKMAKGHNGEALIQKLKNHVSTHATLLELGTGPGADWDILRKDFVVTGSDYSDEFLSRLKAKFPKGSFIRIDATDFTLNDRFDVIYSNKVLHHLTDKELLQSIKIQYEHLTENGLVCHSFWKGKGTEYFEGMFVNNHTVNELRIFFEEQYKILELKEYAEFEAGDSIILIARKK